MTFTRPTLRAINAALLLEMQAVGDRHGFKVAIDGGSFTDMEARIKVTLTAGTGAEAEANERAAFASDARLIGLTPEHYGKRFHHKGHDYVVKRIKMRARKTPVVCVRVDDESRSFRFPVSYLKLLLGERT